MKCCRKCGRQYPDTCLVCEECRQDLAQDAIIIKEEEFVEETTLIEEQALVPPQTKESTQRHRVWKNIILTGILLAFIATILFISNFSGFFKNIPTEDTSTQKQVKSVEMKQIPGEDGKNQDVCVINDMFGPTRNSESNNTITMPQSIKPADEEDVPAGSDTREIRIATINLYIYVVNGDKNSLIKLLKYKVADKIWKNKQLEEIGDMGIVYFITEMISEKKCTIKFKNLKAKISKYTGNRAVVDVSGTAVTTFKGSSDERPVKDKVYLEKENEKWKVVKLQGI